MGCVRPVTGLRRSISWKASSLHLILLPAGRNQQRELSIPTGGSRGPGMSALSTEPLLAMRLSVPRLFSSGFTHFVALEPWHVAGPR